MLTYCTAFVVSILLVFLSTVAKKKAHKIALMTVATLPFIIISTFRSWTVGIDTWKNYWPAFESVALYGERFNIPEYLSAKYSSGFSFLLFILAQICTHPAILFATCSIIITGLTYASIYQNSKSPVLSVFIFFFSGAFLLSLNGMRSYVAIAIVFYAFRFIKERSLAKYTLLIIVASMIHTSVAPFIILYPLYHLNIAPTKLLLCIFISILILPFIRPIAAFILNGTSYANYFKGNVYIDPLFSMLFINTIILIAMLYMYLECRNDQEYNFYLKLQTISVIICIVSFCIPQTYRIEQLVDYWQIISIPYILYGLKAKLHIAPKISFIVLFFILTIYGANFLKSFVFHDDNQVRDYTSILNQ